MEGSNPLLPQHSPPNETFGGTANALARLGRPLPGPFAHSFASPIAPYTMPTFPGASGHQAPNGAPPGGPQGLPQSIFADSSTHHLHSTLASMAAYSFDSLLSANFNNFANLLMMGPNGGGVGGLSGLQPPPAALLSAFANPAAGHHHQQAHSPSPTSTHSSPSPSNYFRSRDTPTIESKSGGGINISTTTTNNNGNNHTHNHNHNQNKGASSALNNHHGGSSLVNKTSGSNRKGLFFFTSHNYC